MKYQEIHPGERLKHLVKCFYLYESLSEKSFDDTVFPSGCPEVIFNLGEGQWHTEVGGQFILNPLVELWGQLIKPLQVRSIGSNTMLGIRFLPYAASYFIDEKFDLFNGVVANYVDISGPKTRELHAKLLSTNDTNQRVKWVENFLIDQLDNRSPKQNKLPVVIDVMKDLKRQDFFDNMDDVASRYGISSRYLQKLFLQYTGLTPKLYTKINRFQNSLRLVTKKDLSLTSIAYDCGYFDQSHFIRDFKSFTGYTPTVYSLQKSSINFAFAAI